MIKVEEKEEIRKLYFRKRWSIRKIARELHHSRKTVRRALNDPYSPVYRRKAPPPERVLGPIKHIIDTYLKEDEKRPRKQRHTARRIYHRLVEEHDFKGSESTVRRYVRALRGKQKEVFIPLEYDPGSCAQADWGEAYVIIRGVKTLVKIFCMKLCSSRKPFVSCFPFEKQEAFFEGHKRAFDFFDGVSHTVIWDNLKVAVKKILKGKNRVEQTSFIAFRSHYLFDSRFINPGCANENAKVENLVGYARRNFFVPLPQVESFDELNRLLLKKCQREDERVLPGCKESIGKMWQKEKEKLLPLPKRSFPCCSYRPVKANSLSYISFEQNRYSVPVRYAYHNLILKAFVDRVDIFYQEKLIASHKRLLGKGEEALDIFHYLPLLLKKPGAFYNARPIRNWSAPPIYFQILHLLKRRYADPWGIREFIKILQLQRNGNKNKLEKAIKMAIKLNSISFDSVKNILDSLEEDGVRTKALDLSSHRYLSGYRIEKKDIGVYNLLLGEPNEN